MRHTAWRTVIAAALTLGSAALIPAGTATAAATHGRAARSPATAAGGTKLWLAHYDAGGRGASGVAVAASPSGSVVFVTGLAYRKTKTGVTNETATVAYNATTGARLWLAQYSPAGAGPNKPAAIAVSPDGSTVFVTGSTLSAGGASSYLTIAYNAATGARDWVDNSGVTGGGRAVTTSPDGSTVFVTGAPGVFGSPDTVALSAATGATLWKASIDSDGVGLATSPDGSTVFVAGAVTASSGLVVAAYNAATGAKLWAVTPGLAPAALAVSPSGSTVFVTGSGVTAKNVHYYSTTAYSAANGASIWNRRLTSRYGNSTAIALAVSPSGSTVFVTGTTAGPSPTNGYGTVAYDAASGATVWTRTVFPNPHDSNRATAIAVSPDGSKVFVTGMIAKQFNSFGTVAYAAGTGVKLWTATHHGPSAAGSFATSIAVSPDSSMVFVTGATGTGNPTPPTVIQDTVAYQS